MSELRKLKITEMNRLSVEEFKEAEKLPLVVVLDEVRSLHNIGAYSVLQMLFWLIVFIYVALLLHLLIQRCIRRP